MQVADKVQANTKPADDQSRWRALATRFRKGRFVLFKSLVQSLPRPLSILDVGGTQEFWETMEFIHEDVKVVVQNHKPVKVTYPSLTCVVGDACNMPEFQDKEFDIAFSNSVIEHVGTFEQQRQMANEVQRVGKRYFVQTPNRYFPIEPHFLFPLFQFLPLGLKVFIVTHFKTGWGWKIADREKAVRFVSHIRLLTEKELKSLFPAAKIYKEKFLGLTKSFIVYDGWEE